MECIFELNFKTEAYNVICTLEQPFRTQPILLQINEEQDVFVACSVGDGYLYNAKTNKQIDIDKEFNIDLIKSVIFDEDTNMIYLACNRKGG